MDALGLKIVAQILAMRYIPVDAHNTIVPARLWHASVTCTVALRRGLSLGRSVFNVHDNMAAANDISFSYHYVDANVASETSPACTPHISPMLVYGHHSARTALPSGRDNQCDNLRPQEGGAKVTLTTRTSPRHPPHAY